MDILCRKPQRMICTPGGMGMKTSLKKLVRRYEAGERDPALIRELNRLAWEGFHDPWEAVPDSPQKEASMREEVDPQIVQPISGVLIERYLKDQDLRALKGQDDYYLVHFEFDAECDREIRIYLSLEGEARELFVLKILGDRRVVGSRCSEAMAFCNRWNGDHRWPKAFLQVPEVDEPQEVPGGAVKLGSSDSLSGTLVLEAQFDFSAGIHQALFNDLITSNIQAGWEFWRRAHQHGF